jgi:hypothetical protein
MNSVSTTQTAVCPESARIRRLETARLEQFLFLDLQRARQKDQFRISHTADLCFDFRNGVLANVPTDARTTSREHRLRPAFAVADFSHDRANNILRNALAHDFLLTVCKRGLRFLPISEGLAMPGKFTKQQKQEITREWKKIIKNRSCLQGNARHSRFSLKDLQECVRISVYGTRIFRLGQQMSYGPG